MTNTNKFESTSTTRLFASFLKTATLLLLLLSFQSRAHADDVKSAGYLQVFSSTQQSQWGEGSYYQLHTSYRVYDANGKPVKYVTNHDNIADETPTMVALAPGKYTVVAQSDKEGLVKVPVTVKFGQTTAVHLEGDHRAQCLNGAAANKNLLTWNK